MNNNDYTDMDLPTGLPEDNEEDLDELRDHIADELWDEVYDWALDHEDSDDPVIQEKVIEAYRLASDHDIICATTNLANLYYTGRIAEQDYKEAFRLNKIAADAGDRRAICNCGYSFYYGRHTAPDYAQAGMYFSLGAVLYNDANCLYKLGDLFLNGYGMEKNERYALKLYNRALGCCQENQADQYSTADVALRIGKCLLRGIGVDKDADQAITMLTIALVSFYERRDSDPYVAGRIAETKELIAEAEAILDAEITRNI